MIRLHCMILCLALRLYTLRTLRCTHPTLQSQTAWPSKLILANPIQSDTRPRKASDTASPAPMCMLCSGSACFSSFCTWSRGTLPSGLSQEGAGRGARTQGTPFHARSKADRLGLLERCRRFVSNVPCCCSVSKLAKVASALSRVRVQQLALRPDKCDRHFLGLYRVNGEACLGYRETSLLCIPKTNPPRESPAPRHNVVHTSRLQMLERVICARHGTSAMSAAYAPLEDEDTAPPNINEEAGRRRHAPWPQRYMSTWYFSRSGRKKLCSSGVSPCSPPLKTG